MTVTCIAPATMDLGAYGEGEVTIRVSGPVFVQGEPGMTTLAVDVPAGTYLVSSNDTPGGGAQGILLDGSSPGGVCNVM